jgi:transposase
MEMIRLERTESGFSWKLDRDSLRKASRFDGILVLKTNSKTLSVEEVAKGYRTLWRVEDAFRHIKDHIGLRPIRHWNDSRVLGHVFVCVLAYTLERLYERELAKAGLGITARAALDELRSMVVATLEVGEKHLRRRSEITPRQRQLLAAVGITEVPELW